MIRSKTPVEIEMSNITVISEEKVKGTTKLQPKTIFVSTTKIDENTVNIFNWYFFK